MIGKDTNDKKRNPSFGRIEESTGVTVKVEHSWISELKIHALLFGLVIVFLISGWIQRQG